MIRKSAMLILLFMCFAVTTEAATKKATRRTPSNPSAKAYQRYVSLQNRIMRGQAGMGAQGAPAGPVSTPYSLRLRTGFAGYGSPYDDYVNFYNKHFTLYGDYNNLNRYNVFDDYDPYKIMGLGGFFP